MSGIQTVDKKSNLSDEEEDRNDGTQSEKADTNDKESKDEERLEQKGSPDPSSFDKGPKEDDKDDNQTQYQKARGVSTEIWDTVR